ncbi:OmpA family protein [Pseudenhygromyxa sp. WMMC2535]|uniref:OmpA/MotB family protein n=1 Tax=Pseudenhygromyxa sp. WMMC2535 TaxID=2712867 RepID=UPI00155308D4|nr:OmpA family protein [Pseudenhygromyxa sp. WMMC2535]NVB42730.1 OmpA family protein [Pseudenhygromyxa sp. WMMC2535]
MVLRCVRTPLALSLLLASAVACGGDRDQRIAELEAEVEALQTEAKASSEAGATKLEAAEAKVETLETKVEEQAGKIAELEGDKGSLEGELEQKSEALEQIKTLQDALAKSLVEEIETGDIRVSERGGYLVVDVSDKVLFSTGEAELSERGQKVISRLAESLLALPDQAVFQVGGHTDNQPIKSEEVKAKFPTNWELSAARATNVVRFLEESCEVPGKRLVAAGFSQFRPVANNKKPKSRAKNRRIEIALLPPRA